MWQKLQTYIFVTVITALIWLYAESENLREDTVYADIEFVAPAGRQLLIDPRQPQGAVLVTVRGPTTQMARLTREEGEDPIQLELVDDPTAETPMREVDLFEELKKHPRYLSLGIQVTEVVPRRVNVRVERYATRELPVEAPAPGEFQFTETPIVDPAQATIRMPASLMSAIPDDARIVAKLEPKDLAQRQVNIQHVIVNVPLLLPGAQGIDRSAISPTAATVTLTISQKTKQTAPMSLPIKINVSISELQRYDVQLVDQSDPWIRNVVLSGPNELIDQINDANKTIKVWAELRLDTDDLDKAAGKESASANVYLNVPPGILPAEPPAAIKYRVTKKSQPIVAP